MIFIYEGTENPAVVPAVINGEPGWSVNVDDGADHGIASAPIDSEDWDGEQILFMSGERMLAWATALLEAVKASVR